jgi:hypothetical protein
MRGLLTDNNIGGQVEILRIILEGEDWGSVWRDLALPVQSLADLGLAENTPDVVIWRQCQQERLVLLTANRNDDGPDSLEAAIRNENGPACLPVLTLADSERVRHSRAYAEQVVERLLYYLMYIDEHRGTGRLYLP